MSWVGGGVGVAGWGMTVQRTRRPRTQTTAAPSMAKPITFNPSPTGVVSVTGGGGGVDGESEQEAQAMKSPATGSRRSIFRECRQAARGDV